VFWLSLLHLSETFLILRRIPIYPNWWSYLPARRRVNRTGYSFYTIRCSSPSWAVIKDTNNGFDTPFQALSKAYQLISFQPFNAQLNPICHLLALLGAHPILHVSRIRVNGPIHPNLPCAYRTHLLLLIYRISSFPLGYFYLLFGHAWQPAKSNYYLLHVCLSVRPSVRVKQLMPTGRNLSNLIFEYFSKICRENSSFTKIWQE
jgi:hypothetical protein